MLHDFKASNLKRASCPIQSIGSGRSHHQAPRTGPRGGCSRQQQPTIQHSKPITVTRSLPLIGFFLVSPCLPSGLIYPGPSPAHDAPGCRSRRSMSPLLSHHLQRQTCPRLALLCVVCRPRADLPIQHCMHAQSAVLVCSALLDHQSKSCAFRPSSTQGYPVQLDQLRRPVFGRIDRSTGHSVLIVKLVAGAAMLCFLTLCYRQADGSSLHQTGAGLFTRSPPFACPLPAAQIS